MTHDELYAAWVAAKAKVEALAPALHEAMVASNAADHEAEKLELALMEMEGRGHTDHAAWLRARVAGDMKEWQRLMAERPHTYWGDVESEPTANGADHA